MYKKYKKYKNNNKQHLNKLHIHKCFHLSLINQQKNNLIFNKKESMNYKIMLILQNFYNKNYQLLKINYTNKRKQKHLLTYHHLEDIFIKELI